MNIAYKGEIAYTGNVSHKGDNVLRRKVLRKGDTLHIGTTCNDGRPITESARYKEAVRLGIPIVRINQEEKKTTPCSTELWVDKYAPSTLANVIGHKESITQLKQWLESWPAQGHGVLLSGPPGIGKSTVAHLLAAAYGYIVAEYNASDTRSISMLRGLFALGMKRLRKELVIMDEVDGFTAQDRGGVGELADLIKKSNCPIICIANQLPPKLAPLQKVCLVAKFSRPVKSTIATAVLAICNKEGITKSKTEIESMCETSGNDIRSIINQLQFGSSSGEKDNTLRLDLFSATQKLMSNKRCSLNEADDFVYVDYGMVPLMVQEAYLAASRSLEEAVAASEQVSFGDIVSTRQWKTQDWSLLPQVVHSTVATSRKVTGPCPFQIFPRLLGQNSKKMKHRRWMEEIGRVRGLNASAIRLDEVEPIQRLLLSPLASLKGDNKKTDTNTIHEVITRMDSLKLTRDQLIENIGETSFAIIEIPTKIKTAFTREYNKGHSVVKKVAKGEEEEEEAEAEEEAEDEEIEYD